MIASLVFLWVVGSFAAYGTLHSYYQIIRPRHYRLRLIAGAIGGPITMLICAILVLRYHTRLPR